MATSRTGGLTLIATPIGNLADLSQRAVDGLRDADLIACEDTRHTRGLLTHLGVSGKRLVSLHEHNERSRIQHLIERMQDGESVALVSDAGMPLISDPGALLISACHLARVSISVIPGPSAALAALAVSGLGDGRFCFEGFLPRKGSERAKRIGEIAVQRRVTVLFESPRRLLATLEQLSSACGGDRTIVVARELTKMHEEVWRGTLDRAVERARHGEPRGEHTLVLEGAPEAEVADGEAVEAAVAKLLSQGRSTKDISEQVASSLRVPRRMAYDTVLRLLAARADPS